MSDDDRPDVDRAAILKRRQRFIALTISGLVVACGDDASGPGTGMGSTGSVSMEGSGDSGVDPSATGAVTPGDGTTTEVSASSGGTSTGATGTDSSTGESSSDSGPGDSTGRPQPCLAPPGVR